MPDLAGSVPVGAGRAIDHARRRAADAGTGAATREVIRGSNASVLRLLKRSFGTYWNAFQPLTATYGPRLHAAHWCRRARVALVLGLALAAVACSDDDASADGDGTTTTTLAATTTTTHPAATEDQEAAFDAVEEVVLEATSLADRLFQDPTVVDDPDDEALVRLRELYSDDSPTPNGVEAQLREMVENGERGRPTPGGAVYREVVPYAFEAIDEDTVRFDTCNQRDSQIVDADGEVVETIAEIVFVGGTAERVDGVWRFVGLSSDLDRSNSITPGTSEAGYCADFVADDRTRGEESS